MPILRRLGQGLAVLLAAAPGLAASPPVIIHVPGYSYSPFVTTSATGVEDIELDPEGNVYQVSSGDIRRITPGGVAAPWSTAVADDIVFTSAGAAYGAGRALCHCIQSISADGSFTALHSDSLEWSYVALGTDATLYSSVPAGVGQGLYSVNEATGVPGLLVSGGPGPGGAGTSRSMLVGMDGKLYETGFGGGAQSGIFRLDGNQFTLVGDWPNGGLGLAQDNQGIFYTSVSIIPPFGPATHEVWMFAPSTGTASLLAEGSGGSNAVAYDRARNILYVQSGSSIYMIMKSATPTLRETWSAVKAKFR